MKEFQTGRIEKLSGSTPTRGGLILPNKFKKPTEKRIKTNEWDKTPVTSRPQTPRQGSWSSKSKKLSPSDWEIETPRHASYDDEIPHGMSSEQWKDEQIRLDRDWYNQEDSGTMDEEHSHFQDSNGYFKKKEEQMKIQKEKRVTAFQAQANRDNDLWEKKRMLQRYFYLILAV
jgi:pre-mRNA-splicing factor ATP-dependent RNA helicase DHX38/PRP16